jgi:crotonobetainyl-CoA:carnitine CoA-transferase CaiB-like acyl-CoA transferase
VPGKSVIVPDVPANNDLRRPARRRPDDGIAGAYCAKLLTDLGADVVFAQPVDDPLFTYLRTSQRTRPIPRRGSAAADMVIVGEPGRAPAGGPARDRVDHRRRSRRARRRSRCRPTRCSRRAAAASPSTGTAIVPPLTVGGHLGEYVTGAYAALGAATAWRRASRTGVPEVVDASMLEAIQMTHTVVPTLMSRFPGGGMASFRWVMIPGNEPTGDDRFVGITTVTEAQWRSLAQVIGRDDMAADEELGTMIGRFRHAKDVNDALRGWTGARTAEEVVDACVEARVPATIVGNGAELPRFDHVIEREVLVQQPASRGCGRARRSGFHGRARPRARRARGSRRGCVAGRSPRSAARGGGRTAARRRQGARLHRVLGWPGGDRVARAMGADVIKVEAVQLPDGHPLLAMVRPSQDPQFYEMSALFHAVNLGKRGITLDLGHPTDSSSPRGSSRGATWWSRTSRRLVLEQFGLDYDVVRSIRPDAVMVRMPAFGLTGPWRDRPGFAQTMEQITGMAWVTGYEAARRSSPAVRSTRWSARTRRSRSSPRSRTGTAAARDSWWRWRCWRSRPPSPPSR